MFKCDRQSLVIITMAIEKCYYERKTSKAITISFIYLLAFLFCVLERKMIEFFFFNIAFSRKILSHFGFSFSVSICFCLRQIDYSNLCYNVDSLSVLLTRKWFRDFYHRAIQLFGKTSSWRLVHTPRPGIA